MIYEGDLHVFLTVIETGGVSSAARRLRMAPSNVTTRIQHLERELGVVLFVREGRRLSISAQGRTFQQYALELTRVHAAARSALHEDDPVGEFRLGAMESVAATRLPRALSEFHRQHPNASVLLETGNTEALLERLQGGALEAAVLADLPRIEGLASCVVSREELVLIAPTGHLPIRTPRDLRYHSCFAFARGCAYRRRFEEWLKSGGITPLRFSELGSFHAIIACVAAGMGVAAIPRVVLDQFGAGEALSVHSFPKAVRSVVVSLAWRKQGTSPRVNAFAALLRGNQSEHA